MPFNQEPYDLEAVYDAEIAPLMTQIIAICQREGLPMIASFAFRRDERGEYDLATTAIPRSTMVESESPVFYGKILSYLMQVS